MQPNKYQFTHDPYDTIESVIVVMPDQTEWRFSVDWEVSATVNSEECYLEARPEVVTTSIDTAKRHRAPYRPSNYDRFKAATGLTQADVTDLICNNLAELEAIDGAIEPLTVRTVYLSSELTEHDESTTENQEHC